MNFKLLLIAIILGISGCNPGQAKTFPDHEIGIRVAKEDKYGRYYQYVPKNTEDLKVLVIVHGSLKSGEPAIKLAEKFISRWIDYSEEKGFLLIAPAFDRDNFQSYGGYRGLFGREIGADEFVNRLVDQYKDYFPNLDGSFYLYGHSAGAQFGVRFSVKNPNRIIKAVLSAPGRFAFPNEEAPWPYGAGRLARDIEYKNPQEIISVDVQPDLKTWIEAASLPITILVGSEDLKPQPKRPGHRGITRIDLAENWVSDMNKLADQNGKVGNVNVEVIEGIGHSSKRLTPFCQDEL